MERKDSKMKLIEYLKEYIEYCKYRKELNYNTLKAYKIDIKQFTEYLNGRTPTKEIIEKYITILHKRFKQKTIKRKIASIKAFYRYLEEQELLRGENPFYKIRVKFKEKFTLPRVIPRKNIEKLLNYMYECKRKNKNNRNIVRNLCIIELLFATGMRVGELSNLKKENIDLESGIIYIVGKGDKERSIQIVDNCLLNLLKQYRQELEEESMKSDYFFMNERGKRYTEQSVRLMIKKYTKDSGIMMKITPHMFRHSFATYLVEEGVDISCLRTLLGHSSIKTTQIYVYVAVKIQSEILKRKHPRNQMKIISI